jgi:hypothetical protein
MRLARSVGTTGAATWLPADTIGGIAVTFGLLVAVAAALFLRSRRTAMTPRQCP